MYSNQVDTFQLDPESEDDWPPPWLGYVLAVALFLVSMVQTMVLQQYWKRTYQVIHITTDLGMNSVCPT